MVDWSMVPSDVLAEIALRMETMNEFAYFSMVCHSWKYAASKAACKRNARTVVPWLLLAESKKKNRSKQHLRKMYDLSSNKCYQSSMPETFGAQCWGSCYGWIVMLTVEQEVQLYNPLNKNRITTLPSIQNRPIELPFDPLTDDSDNKLRFVVLKMHPSDDLLIVAMIYGFKGTLVVARPGDQAWTFIDDHVQDVVYRGDYLYIVGSTGWLRYCDIKRVNDFNDVEVMDYVPPFRTKTKLNSSEQVYLVNTGDDLLMVLRVKYRYADIHDLFDYGTHIFEVYTLDSTSKEWEIVENFGDFSLFVGCNSSMAVPKSEEANNLKCNCIYYTDDGKNYWLTMPELGGRDMGVYDLETKKFTKFYQGDDMHSSFCPPLFFVPYF